MLGLCAGRLVPFGATSRPDLGVRQLSQSGRALSELRVTKFGRDGG